MHVVMKRNSLLSLVPINFFTTMTFDFSTIAKINFMPCFYILNKLDRSVIENVFTMPWNGLAYKVMGVNALQNQLQVLIKTFTSTHSNLFFHSRKLQPQIFYNFFHWSRFAPRQSSEWHSAESRFFQFWSLSITLASVII